MRPGQPVTVTVDTYPDVEWHGTVESVSPAAAQEFSLLPAQNTSGNWVKVVQRVPMRVRVDTSDKNMPPLRAGMSVEVDVDTGHARGFPHFLNVVVRPFSAEVVMPSGTASDAPGGGNRAAITVCVILATLMQALDTTIANVALPYMQGSVSASQDQIDWVLTSYIVAAAIMTPPTGFLAGRFGLKRLFLISIAGFTVASMLCGMAQVADADRVVPRPAGRVRRGAGSAVADRSAQHQSAGAAGLRHGAVRRRRDGRAGARSGARRLADRELHLALRVLHQSADRHSRAASALRAFLPETKRNSGDKLDWFGFGTLSLAIGALQIMLDRGEATGLVRLRRDHHRG